MLPSIGDAKAEDRYLGERAFAEIAVRHRSVPEGAWTSFDPMSHYVIDRRARVMELQPPIGAAKLDEFVSNDALVAHGIIPNYFPLGTTVPARPGVDPQIDGLRKLQVVGEYTRPAIRTGIDSDGTVSVTVRGHSVTVDARSRNAFSLDPVGVTYRRTSDEVIRVRGRDGRTTKTPRASTGRALLTPVVEVINHGTLDVVAPEEVLG